MRSTYDLCAHGSMAVPVIYYLDRASKDVQSVAAYVYKLLHPAERNCIQGLHHADIRDRYGVSRAILRLLLFAFTGRSWDAAALFADGCSGRPLPVRLADGTSLLHSISHSARLSSFAFICQAGSKNEGIGVDMESPRIVRHPLAAAEFAFSSSELTALRGTRSELRNDLFLRLWTRKEAVVKCCGGSVAHDMDRFDVPIDDSPGSWDIHPECFGLPEDLRLVDIDLGPLVHAAMCWRGKRSEVEPIYLDAKYLDGLVRGFSTAT